MTGAQSARTSISPALQEMPESLVLRGLNKEQRAAVLAPMGPVIVLAGPGSGKTRVLTCRIGLMIERGYGSAGQNSFTARKERNF